MGLDLDLIKFGPVVCRFGLDMLEGGVQLEIQKPYPFLGLISVSILKDFLEIYTHFFIILKFLEILEK